MDQIENDDERRQALTEPLLELEPSTGTGTCTASAEETDVRVAVATDHPTGSNDSDDESSPSSFSVRSELWAMASLGFPLAVSFFCRMGMASTDSAFVGHLNDGYHTAETYLAAAVLSDMMVNIFCTPPLAFNQVLNALVGQSMGSGNPKMAGIWLQQSCFWLTVTMLPCLVGLFYVEPLLRILGFPANVAAVAGTYARYNVVWPVPNGLYQCLRFYFQAQGLAKPAMYNNIVFLFVNAFLNWTFVFGGPFRHIWGWKGLGFIGAAVSLSISRTMQGVTYFLYMFVYKKHHLNTWPTSSSVSATANGSNDGEEAEDSTTAGSFLQHHTAARTWEFLKQSLPNIGTLLFQVASSQATTVLVGRLGELPIAASSALSTVTIPWSGSLSATCSTISGVRVGYHLGRGNAKAARATTHIVLTVITVVTAIMAAVFVTPHWQSNVLGISTNDHDVLQLAKILVPAMLVGTYLNLMVGNITQGVFGGMGRPVIATILSLGLELPLSIGGVAVYILVMHGNLLGVYWWQAISGAIELVIVAAILSRSNWQACADEARRRNEANNNDNEEEEDGATTDPESGLSSNEASVASDEGDDGN